VRRRRYILNKVEKSTTIEWSGMYTIMIFSVTYCRNNKRKRGYYFVENYKCGNTYEKHKKIKNI